MCRIQTPGRLRPAHYKTNLSVVSDLERHIPPRTLQPQSFSRPLGSLPSRRSFLLYGRHVHTGASGDPCCLHTIRLAQRVGCELGNGVIPDREISYSPGPTLVTPTQPFFLFPGFSLTAADEMIAHYILSFFSSIG